MWMSLGGPDSAGTPLTQIQPLLGGQAAHNDLMSSSRQPWEVRDITPLPEVATLESQAPYEFWGPGALLPSFIKKALKARSMAALVWT